jgi:hypothetical protein
MLLLEGNVHVQIPTKIRQCRTVVFTSPERSRFSDHYILAQQQLTLPQPKFILAFN